jgi:hypothetical protein
VDGQRKALIVANGEYDHEGLRHLRSPGADAAALADVLGDPAIGGFDVVVVRDEPAHVVQAQIEELFSSSRGEDLLLLHFSCHGLKSDSGELFFAVRNTRPDRLASSAVPADFVQRCIRGSRSRSVVLLLDCCYGGAYGRGVAVRSSGEANVMDSFPQQRLGGGRGRAVITASSAIEYAFEGDQLADENALQPSVFTSALVRGLKTGEADRDEDGLVSLNELYDYVFDQVREKNPNQTPSRDIEMAGELFLARSRRRRIKPAPMPPDLEAAIHDANMYSRIGAIGELRARLLSDNLAAAAGAHGALTEMARTDIGYVAELAESACRDAALQVEPAEIHFGPVLTGSPPPHRTIQLLGPPIARACVPHISDDWLRVTVSETEVDVSVDTEQAGTLHGSVTLKGPTGEFVVTVAAEVAAAVPRQAASPEASGRTQRQAPAPAEMVSVVPEPRQEAPPESVPVEAALLEAAARPPERQARPPRPPLPTGARTPPPVPPHPHTAPPPTGLVPPTPPPVPPHPHTAPPPTGLVPPTPPVSGGLTSAPTRPPTWSVLWALLPVLSIGFLAPVPLFHAAIRLKSFGLALASMVYAAGVVVFVAMSQDWETESGFVAIGLAVLASTHAFLIRTRVFAPSSAPALTLLDSARPVTPKPPMVHTAPPAGGQPDAQADGVPTLRLVALGVAGSGKTVFLSSMFHTLNVPMPGHSYFLETDAAHRVYLSRVFDEVSDTGEPWPRGTRAGESRELVFDCVSYREGVKHRICRISYLDYAGELLETEPEAGATALQELEQRIKSAQGLLGMLDGFRVLQYLRNEPAGRRYFRSSLQPMIGMMAGATCPIHFALTKWDLVREFGESAEADDATRLALVSEALLDNVQIRALVDAHSYGNRVVRLFPVSAVGPDFALIDSGGHVVKRQDGLVRPSHVELPLSAVLPDLFSHVDLSMVPRLQAAVTTAAQARIRLSSVDAERQLVLFQMSPDGFELRRVLEGALGPHGDALVSMFLDWKGRGLGGLVGAGDPSTLAGARSRVIAEFDAALTKVEADLPASRLSARP